MRQVEAYQYVIQIEDKLAALGEGLSDQDRVFFSDQDMGLESFQDCLV